MVKVSLEFVVAFEDVRNFAKANTNLPGCRLLWDSVIMDQRIGFLRIVPALFLLIDPYNVCGCTVRDGR